MLNNQLKAQFNRDGYSLLPQILSSQEIIELRRITAEIFDSAPTYAGDRKNIRFNWIVRYPALSKIILNKNFLSAMKEIAGPDFLIVPDAAFMDSCYGGWHRDTGPLELKGKFFHYEPECLFVNAAIYLQDNHKEYAGGLDIVPGSHRTQATWWQKQKSSNTQVKFIFHQLIKRKILSDSFIHSRKGQLSIPSKAGDIVCFHHQCDHRATQVKKKPVPESHRKFALFFSFSPQNKYAKMYVDHCRARNDNIFLRDYSYPKDFFEKIPAAFGPHFYVDEKISLV